MDQDTRNTIKIIFGIIILIVLFTLGLNYIQHQIIIFEHETMKELYNQPLDISHWFYSVYSSCVYLILAYTTHMLRNILITATRAHYAALQHRASKDRIALDFTVNKTWSGTIFVKASTNSRRKAEMTKLLNRLKILYPGVSNFSMEYRSWN